MKRKYIVHVLIYYYAASLCECRYLAIHGVERLEPLHEQQSESVLRNEKYLCRTADYIFLALVLPQTENTTVYTFQETELGPGLYLLSCKTNMILEL